MKIKEIPILFSDDNLNLEVFDSGYRVVFKFDLYKNKIYTSQESFASNKDGILLLDYYEFIYYIETMFKKLDTDKNLREYFSEKFGKIKQREEKLNNLGI